jgi:hypothetical protein
MASRRSNNRLRSFAVLLLIAAPFTGRSQEIPDSSDVRMELPHMRMARHSIGLDLGIDISDASAIRIGYASSWQEWSCALGAVSSGTTAGISYNPTLNACGLYLGRWLTLAIVDLGLRFSYETNLTHQWSVIQPQIGLGFGLFRLTYNYNIPFFFGSRLPDFQRHAFGIACTFKMEEKDH